MTARKKLKIQELVKQRAVEDLPIKLHLGCGDQHLDGWINSDYYDLRVADVQVDASKIPLPDNSVDEIYASHLIEHFDFHQGWTLLGEWHRVLKKSGKLTLETPDLLGLCQEFPKADTNGKVMLYGAFFGFPWYEGNGHKFLYTEVQLFWTLSKVGFTNILRVKPDSIYARSAPQFESTFLKVESYKK
jgi:predicted SAM-dependent methyltransferase